MKALVCELCGSNDIVKQDGYFVCQHCGTKYSLEEAKKLILEITEPVEVKGTVTIDNSAQIDKLLAMTSSAWEGKDYDKVIEYTDKVLEIAPDNPDAWIYRAMSICQFSSLGDIKISQSIVAAKKAVELSPEESKTELADNLYIIQKRVIVFLLSKANGLPMSSAIDYIHKVMVNWNNLLVGSPYISKELIQKEIADCKTICDNSRKAFMPSKRYVYAAYFSYNHKESYDVTFRKNLGIMQ